MSSVWFGTHLWELEQLELFVGSLGPSLLAQKLMNLAIIQPGVVLVSRILLVGLQEVSFFV